MFSLSKSLQFILLVLSLMAVPTYSHQGHSSVQQKREAAITQRLLESGFSLEEATVSGLLKLAKSRERVANSSNPMSIAIILGEFLPFSSQNIDGILDLIFETESSQKPIEHPEALVSLIFKNQLLSTRTLERVDQLRLLTKNLKLQYSCIVALRSRLGEREEWTKHLLNISANEKSEVAILATLSLLQTVEEDYASHSLINHVQNDEQRKLLFYELRNGEHFEKMSDQLLKELLKMVTRRDRAYLLAALRLTNASRAEMLSSSLSLKNLCWEFLSNLVAPRKAKEL